MIAVERTEQFQSWLERLRDRDGRARIRVRIMRMELGHFGDTRAVGGGVHEARLHFGPGYRLYFCWRGDQLVLLLGGGDKSTQASDIAAAIRRKADLET